MSLNELIGGYREFYNAYFERSIELRNDFQNLAINGQQPKVLIIACSDSRVDPAIITQCSPGDAFVVRNIANIVPPYEKDGAYHGTSAAIEFAIECLQVPDIVILGHSECGGIQYLLDNNISSRSNEADKNEEMAEEKGFLAKWMEIAVPAKLNTLSFIQDLDARGYDIRGYNVRDCDIKDYGDIKDCDIKDHIDIDVSMAIYGKSNISDGNCMSHIEDYRSSYRSTIVSAEISHHSEVNGKRIDEDRKKINVSCNEVCSKFSIINSINNLTTFPWIEARLRNNSLNIHGWYFDIKNGKISTYSSKFKEFQEL